MIHRFDYLFSLFFKGADARICNHLITSRNDIKYFGEGAVATVDDPRHKAADNCWTLSRVVHCLKGQKQIIFTKEIVTEKDGVEISRVSDGNLYCCLSADKQNPFITTKIPG
jgi:hypothetical protein